MTINTNSPVATAPVLAPVSLPDPDSTRMTSVLAHAVLVSGELEQRMAQTLRNMSEGSFDVSSADLLKLQLQGTDLSVWTKTVSASILDIYAPLKEAAGKMS
jgi:hypothetical protein